MFFTLFDLHGSLALPSQPFNCIFNYIRTVRFQKFHISFQFRVFGLKEPRPGVGTGPCKGYILRILPNKLHSNSSTYIKVNEQISIYIFDKTWLQKIVFITSFIHVHLHLFASVFLFTFVESLLNLYTRCKRLVLRKT